MVDQILTKFDLWKDIVSQSCYFKSKPDLVTLKGTGPRDRITLQECTAGPTQGP